MNETSAQFMRVRARFVIDRKEVVIEKTPSQASLPHKASIVSK